MKKKIAENFKKFKELYANRRYRAMMILGLYVIFFLIVVAIITTGKTAIMDNDDNQDLTTIDKFKAMNNYEYSYNVEKSFGKDVIYFDIEGKRYFNKEEFNIKDDINGYYVEDNVVYLTRDNVKEKLLDGPLSIDLVKLRPFNLANLIQMAQLETSTNNYTDDTVEKNYLLPVKDFIKLYFNADVEDKDGDFVSIKTYEKDGNITKVEMDLTKADKYDDYLIDCHKLEFNYSNINQVKDFTETAAAETE